MIINELKGEKVMYFRKILSLIMVSIMLFVLNNNSLAAEYGNDKNEEKSFRSIYNVINTEEWSKMTREERVSACQIPSNQLSQMSTNELLQAVLEYPFWVEIFMFDTIELGYRHVLTECEALQTLVARPDRVETILDVYQNTKVVESIKTDADQEMFSNLWGIEILVSQKEFISAMTEIQKQQLLKIVDLKKDEKKNNETIYGISKNAFYTSATENGNIELLTSATVVYTPNGSAVNVEKWNNADDELTAEEKKSINSQTAKAYPNAIKLAEPTRKYNCHSYAWYSQSTANIIWMNNPSKYMTDGSYKKVTNKNATVGDRVVYYDSTNGSFTTITHSAIITSKNSQGTSFMLKSKWGQAGLYSHSRDDSPYTYNNKKLCDVNYYHR